jgi:hypothetical protein
MRRGRRVKLREARRAMPPRVKLPFELEGGGTVDVDSTGVITMTNASGERVWMSVGTYDTFRKSPTCSHWPSVEQLGFMRKP